MTANSDKTRALTANQLFKILESIRHQHHSDSINSNRSVNPDGTIFTEYFAKIKSLGLKLRFDTQGELQAQKEGVDHAIVIRLDQLDPAKPIESLILLFQPGAKASGNES